MLKHTLLFMIWYSVINESKVCCYKFSDTAIIFLMMQKNLEFLLLLLIVLDYSN